MFIESGEAAADAAALYEEDLERLGYVANYTKALSARPNVMRAWQELNRAVKSHMDLRLYELATFAAAMQLRSSYCALAHGRVIEQQVMDAQGLADLARDYHSAGLSAAEVAAMEYAEKIAADASQVTEDDIVRLRDHGYSDADIVDIASAAAARCFFSKLLDALGTQPDLWYAEAHSRELQDLLTVGRPIAT